MPVQSPSDIAQKLTDNAARVKAVNDAARRRENMGEVLQQDTVKNPVGDAVKNRLGQ